MRAKINICHKAQRKHNRMWTNNKPALTVPQPITRSPEQCLLHQWELLCHGPAPSPATETTTRYLQSKYSVETWIMQQSTAGTSDKTNGSILEFLWLYAQALLSSLSSGEKCNKDWVVSVLVGWKLGLVRDIPAMWKSVLCWARNTSKLWSGLTWLQMCNTKQNQLSHFSQSIVLHLSA